jgi:hypothetical protein
LFAEKVTAACISRIANAGLELQRHGLGWQVVFGSEPTIECRSLG